MEFDESKVIDGYKSKTLVMGKSIMLQIRSPD